MAHELPACDSIFTVWSRENGLIIGIVSLPEKELGTRERQTFMLQISTFLLWFFYLMQFIKSC